MADGIYAVAGSFAMRPGTKKGIHVFRYEPENGTFFKLGDYRLEINAGQRAYSEKKGLLYITDESRGREGGLGGGGRIFALRLDRKTGEPEWMGEWETCSTLPSDICLTQSGSYLLVPHHGTENVVTRTILGEDGAYRADVEADDCTLAVFRLKESGIPDGLVHASFHRAEKEKGQIRRLAHLHNCVQSPDGKLFLVCDKGFDRIHSYGLDEKTGTAHYLGAAECEPGSHPRYGVFHKTLPVFYQNCENSAFLHVWNYDSESGNLARVQRISLLFDEKEAAAWTEEGAADLVISENGEFLYASVRGLNVLSVFKIGKEGTLSLIQNIGCQGRNPRGLCLAPDGRFLFSMNRDSDCIARFRVLEDGTLEAAGAETECGLPGNLIFI